MRNGAVFIGVLLAGGIMLFMAPRGSVTTVLNPPLKPKPLSAPAANPAFNETKIMTEVNEMKTAAKEAAVSQQEEPLDVVYMW
jgi:hypothetical protein